MNRGKVWKQIFLVIVLLWAAPLHADDSHTLRMAAPDARALTGATFLEEEAGITAYAQISNVDIAKAEQAYKSVEAKTADYIIGSVALENYDDESDVHVYVDTSGWIAAYYIRDTEPAFIIDWIGIDAGKVVSETKLYNALFEVCNAMLVNLPEISYYDFRYPTANAMMIVYDSIKAVTGTETFRIKIPSSIPVSSRSWSHAVSEYYGNSGYVKISSFEVVNASVSSGAGWKMSKGNLSPTLLPPDVFQEISIYNSGTSSGDRSYFGIVLIYQE